MANYFMSGKFKPALYASGVVSFVIWSYSIFYDELLIVTIWPIAKSRGLVGLENVISVTVVSGPTFVMPQLAYFGGAGWLY